jgi:very-short-patch-repair endonuclease
MRKSPAPGEKWLWRLLRNRKTLGLRFRRQQPIGPYIADFFCPELRLVVELDGSGHDLQVEYDRSRKQWLQSEGYRVLRIGSECKVSDANDIPLVIEQACKEQAELLGIPLPSGERAG